MSYTVHFTGKGWTAPDAKNPNGIQVTGKGEIVVEGERPARSFDIPWAVIERCKKAFIEECHIERYEGDVPGKIEKFPTVRLGKVPKRPR